MAKIQKKLKKSKIGVLGQIGEQTPQNNFRRHCEKKSFLQQKNRTFGFSFSNHKICPVKEIDQKIK
jgi:hypothetical protein